MRGFNFFVTLFTLVGLVATTAKADMLLTNEGNPSDYTIKVSLDQKGEEVAYQLFFKDQYVKNLGDQKSYSVAKVVSYSESLSAAGIKTDASRKILFEQAGGVIGASLGFLAAVKLSQKFAGTGVFRAMDITWNMLLLGPLLTPLAFVVGQEAGSQVDDILFVKANTHNLAALMTNALVMTSKRVVIDSQDPAQAAFVLDQALRTIH